MATMVLLVIGGLGALVAFLAMYLPQALFPLAVAFGLPVVMYGIISLLELIILSTKRDQTQQRRRQAPRGVMQMSRALYEQLDGDMLQLLMSNRDFDSNDYERLMRLEALNERRHEGATAQQIQQLPIVTMTYVALLYLDVSLVVPGNPATTTLEGCTVVTALTLRIVDAIVSRESMLQASENASCTVCLSTFKVDGHVRMMPCFHRFHPECIDPWLQEKALCPICKFPAIA